MERRLYQLFKAQGVIPNASAFNSDDHPVPIRPVALIFGRPSCRVFRDEFLPDRTYYHLRSSDNVELFYMGFDASSSVASAPKDLEEVFDENRFSDFYFVSAVEDVERRTKWRYSGGTDLIFLNACFAPNKYRTDIDGSDFIPEVYLDFSAVLALNLEKALDSKLIPSARALIETIMHCSRECPTTDVVLKVSNEVILKTAGRSLFTWFAGLLKLRTEDFSNSFAAGLSDVSRPATSPFIALDISRPTK